ncbi:MAG TPA: hypothetical protein PKE69_07830 [Pyrinomonadaceae bacterium]|nr:hypothetical protein [Pyrinomonadaceae bacterium]
MDILTGITTAVATLKTGFEIKKLAGNLDSEIQQGELRVQIRKLQESLIEVQDVLLNAKREILENREEIQEKDEEIKKLKKQLKEKENPQVETLSEESVKILNLLSEVPSYEDGLIASQIAYDTHIPEPKTEYLLDLLKEKEFVSFVIHQDIGTQYYINKNGRKYLFESAKLS